MPYVEKTIKSGDFLETVQYFARRNSGKAAAGPALTEEEAAGCGDLYSKRSQKQLMRLINCNFSQERGDLFLTLTYSSPVEEAEAKRQVRNYLRRVRYWREKQGLPELKYILITEKQGKWHHHIIMSAMPMDKAHDLWNRGLSTSSRLDRSNNFQDLSKYLTAGEKPPKGGRKGESSKEPHRRHARRWISSTNLAQPEIKVRPIKRADILIREPKPPKGYRLIKNSWVVKPDACGYIYRYFECIRIEPNDPKPKKPKRRRK